MFEIKFYIPTTPAVPRIALERALETRIGGLTVSKGKGGWNSPDGVRHVERVRILTVIAHSEALDTMHWLAEAYRKDANQEEVLFTVHEVQAHFIKGN